MSWVIFSTHTYLLIVSNFFVPFDRADKKRKAKRGDGKAGVIIEEVDQDGSVNTKKNKKAVLMNVAMGSGKTAQDAGGESSSAATNKR